MRSALLTMVLPCLFLSTGCSSDDSPTDPTGTGGFGADGSGGTGLTGSGGALPGTGGTTAVGGSTGSGGIHRTGGMPATGGVATGGTQSSGGAPTGGVLPTGGTPTGGVPTTGGTPTGGMALTGGVPATGGTATGGAEETGGAETGGGAAVDCSATMPTGGTDHCGQNTQGNAGGLAWSLWSNAINGDSCITTYDAPAFSARWNESSDFLARIGLEWGNNGKPYDQYGNIQAQFAYNKTGTAGGYSYIGVYGWSNDPCVEYYIVEDSWNNFPFNAWNATQTGTAFIDGEDYKLFQNSTPGTGGSRCSGVSTWLQFWSIRQSARQCGTISISDHFDAWEEAGMHLGSMLEAKILVEVGGGQGSIEFPVATVTAE